jgi:hypothetical protein
MPATERGRFLAAGAGKGARVIFHAGRDVAFGRLGWSPDTQQEHQRRESDPSHP